MHTAFMTKTHPGHCCVFGLMWGDEGKGKIVDLLAGAYDCVVRYNGGANAGHTVWIGQEKFALHLLPAGILRTGVVAVIGPGVVVDPPTLRSEIAALEARGIAVAEHLRLSNRAHLVMPYHKAEDRLSEARMGDERKIGTTTRGIGPCYADKARRSTGVRFNDVLHEPGLEDRVLRILEDRRSALAALGGTDDPGLDRAEVLASLRIARDELSQYVCDTTRYLGDAVRAGRRMLFEGANGMLLDLDHGTYPFVTSSSTGPGGIAGGAGVPPTLLRRTIGVTKAYSTRVGGGPFVAELGDELGDRIRKQGNEYGTTTGRPRRCGWFDAVACGYSARLGGATDLAIMHMDTLAGFERVGMCVAYDCRGRKVEDPPAGVAELSECRPVIEYLPGWGEEVRTAASREALPINAQRYIEAIERRTGVAATIISVGPERSQTLLSEPWRSCVAEGGPTA
ncbi:MAG: adenylosuccinate synthetase [Planctomycetota bacterium]|nr:MAG: adenylosuccinate synthetase [Planctomycetota bacterium]